MQTSVQIDFRGMRGRPEVRASIEKHVAQLDGRVTACRVVLKDRAVITGPVVS